MKLEAGKKYVLNDGQVVGPLEARNHQVYPFMFDFQDERGGLTWTSSGEYLHGNPQHQLSIACEFVPAIPAIEEAAENSRGGKEWIPVDKQRDPRVIVVNECHDGQFAFGELNTDDFVQETTAPGETLQVIEGLVLKNRSCGMITRYQEKFIFVAQRYKSKPSCVPAEPPEHPADCEQGELQLIRNAFNTHFPEWTMFGERKSDVMAMVEQIASLKRTIVALDEKIQEKSKVSKEACIEIVEKIARVIVDTSEEWKREQKVDLS